ncbi:unnamed protein product [Cochlearia groenlandica]
MSSSSSDSSSSGSSSSSSGDSLSPGHLRHLEVLERGSPSVETKRRNSRVLPRPDSARDQSSEQITSVPDGFFFDPLARTPPRSPVRQQTEVPHLIDEELTPPPLVRRVHVEKTPTPPEAGRARRAKKPRQINSFASSTSRFDDGLGSTQDISGVGEPLEIIEPDPGQLPWHCLQDTFVFTRQLSPRRACGSPFLGFWSLITRGEG